MISDFKKKLDQLLEECREESYQYFDKNIRPLPKNESGEFIITRKYFYDNDVDAFRHAYTSGVFTQEFFTVFANVLEIIRYKPKTWISGTILLVEKMERKQSQGPCLLSC